MILFTEEKLCQLRKVVAENPGLLQGLRKSCETVLRYGARIPETGIATWGHYFACPEDSTPLTFDYAKDHDFVCPTCQRIYNGEPYLGAWWRSVNGTNSAACANAALVWALTQEKPYQAVSASILLGYADHYKNYELHGGIPYNKPGRMNAQALDEAGTFQQFAMAYDLIGDSLSAAEREHIERDLLELGAQALLENRTEQLHNHEVIIGAGLGMVGIALGREDYIRHALEDKYGLRYQLEHGLLQDGMWFENTFHYHFYGLLNFFAYEKMARNTPYSLLSEGLYRKMLLFPLRALQPDGCFPPLGDGGAPISEANVAFHYEFGYGAYGDRAFAQLLNAAYAQRPRNLLDAQLWGAPSIEDAPPLALADYHDDCASGLTILRGSEQKQYLLFRHGKFGGEHDHYDKLGLHYMAGKHPVMPDLSTVYYGAPMHYDYYKNTFTHNTVCINAQNQPPCDGRTVRFERRGEETLVEGHADWLSPLAELDSFTICQWDEAAYRGVVMRRTILFTDAFFLEAFRVRGAAGRTVDWIVHPMGECSEEPGAYTPVVLGDCTPARYFKQAHGRRAEGVVVSRWRSQAGTFALYSACSAPSSVIYAQGPSNPSSETLTYFIRRVDDCADIVFANLFALAEGEEKIGAVDIAIEGGTVTFGFDNGGQRCVRTLTVGEEI